MFNLRVKPVILYGQGVTLAQIQNHTVTKGFNIGPNSYKPVSRSLVDGETQIKLTTSLVYSSLCSGCSPSPTIQNSYSFVEFHNFGIMVSYTSVIIPIFVYFRCNLSNFIYFVHSKHLFLSQFKGKSYNISYILQVYIFFCHTSTTYDSIYTTVYIRLYIEYYIVYYYNKLHLGHSVTLRTKV